MFDTFSRLIKSILGREEAPSVRGVDELRAEHRTRYHNFKLLLTAVNKALGIMADMDEALRESRVIGMSYIRSSATAVTVNVFRIAQHLDALSPGKYRELFDRLKAIQEGIEGELVRRAPAQSARYVLPLDEVDLDLADQAGGKMAGLGEIAKQLDLAVPEGFVITAGGYDRFMSANDLQAEIDKRVLIAEIDDPDDPDNKEELLGLCAELQELIRRAAIPEDLERAILDGYRQLEGRAGAGAKVSLRSSGLGEDAAGASFAGQFGTVLNVGPERILGAYKDILASKYSFAAMSYRLSRGIPGESIAMAVGCMAMTDAAAGGVLYSRNPLNIRDASVFITAAWGLSKGIVDGVVEPDLFVLSRQGGPGQTGLRIAEKRIGTKREQFVCRPDEGVCRYDTAPTQAAEPCLSDAKALELAAIAGPLDMLYGGPVDVEWAMDRNGRLVILQCRPLKQLEIDEDRLARSGGTPPAPVLVRGRSTASPGVGAGPVCIVKGDLDVVRFPEGGVLVCAEALPRWSAVIGKAAAVVAEGGSAAGHLANIAREFRVPALFDAPGAVAALSALGPDEAVTVDADGHTVYRDRVEALLAEDAGGRERANMMSGSPVLRILAGVLGHVSPLNLSDPDAPTFRARHCRTLHDVIRYCHEMAVYEMFNLGGDDEFFERASKQIVTGSPMQWWVLNLDDGFTHEVAGKFIRLDEIACKPMLAVWQGVGAFPWEGPPPVDSKGFMSIMFQTAVNPDLVGPSTQNFLVKNYFMLSRNYMTLSSRFGYHLTTIEALVGERTEENYVSFQFKGGAAEFERRQRRAFFVADILQEWGYKADVTEDAVFARVEGRDEAYMLERLMILGYLIIHTRQLDMIMKLRAQVERYRDKLNQDIGIMLQGGGPDRAAP